MRTTKKSTPALFYISLFLIAAVLWTSHLTSGLYARYATSDSASDSARVAKFNVSDQINAASAQSFTVSVELYPTQEEAYTFIVTNDSEVLVDYVVRIENLTNNLPLSFSIAGDVVSEKPIRIAIGEEETFTVKINWPEGENAPALMGQVDLVEITLRVEQVTAGE